MVLMPEWLFGLGNWLLERLGKIVGHKVDDALSGSEAKNRSPGKLPKKTLLIAEDLTMVSPHFWQIEKYDEKGSAIGFRALLVVTRLVPSAIKVTAVEARLPWHLRWFRRHRVLKTMFQAFHPHGSGAPEDAITAQSQQASVNFYVRPPIQRTKPISVTVRLRDHLLNWHERKVTFRASP